MYRAVTLAVAHAGDLAFARVDRLTPVATDAHVGIGRASLAGGVERFVGNVDRSGVGVWPGGVCARACSANGPQAATVAAVTAVDLMNSRRVRPIASPSQAATLSHHFRLQIADRIRDFHRGRGPTPARRRNRRD